MSMRKPEEQSRARVLVVDDEPANIHVLHRVLRAEHEVFVATSGQAALDFCAAKHPDLVLLDLVMPELDGLEVCRRLQTGPQTRDIPVVFVTAHDRVEDETAGFAAGAVDFISKPISPPVTLARVRTHLTVKRQADSLRAQLAELRSTQSELLEAQKLEAVGVLAAGLAHEINTPAQFVASNLAFIGRAFAGLAAIATAARTCVEAEADAAALAVLGRAVTKGKLDFVLSEGPSAIQQAVEGVDRIAAIVGALRDFSENDARIDDHASLAQTVSAVLVIATNEWAGVAEVETRLDPELGSLPLPAGELGQLLLALILNAARAIAEAQEGEPSVRGRIVVAARREAESAVIEVSDTGIGIPESIRGRVFEPFFTTRPLGKGVGQGLAVARRIVVERHGGSIGFESEVGRGTKFLVRLPLRERRS
jgi:signal transduction histidine kinase